MDDLMLAIGESLDRICSIEMRNKRLDNGLIPKLYAAARERAGMPLTLHAAQTIVSNVSAGDVVLILTGAGGHVYLPKGETDGPLGAAAIARAVTLGLGAVPVLVTDSFAIEMQTATCVAGSLGIRDLEGARKVQGTCALRTFPTEDTAAAAAAAEIMETLNPKAIIATERLSPNRLGIAHTATGKPAAAVRGRVEHLMDQAKERGIATVGIGDNGNEIGYGAIEEAVRKHKAWGDKCVCPCGAGLAARIATDALIVAGVSNWGAYCLEGAIAALIGKPEIVHTAEDEMRMLWECVRAGAADGRSGRHVMTVDGTPATVQTAVLELVRNVVGVGLSASAQRAW